MEESKDLDLRTTENQGQEQIGTKSIETQTNQDVLNAQTQTDMDKNVTELKERIQKKYQNIGCQTVPVKVISHTTQAMQTEPDQVNLV